MDSPPPQAPPSPSAEQTPRPSTPDPYIGSEDGLKYELSVVQPPVRARMCGFGDKDRRPITSPPCIRLVIRNNEGQEVNYEDIDITFYLMTVDLWSPDGLKEINLVKHSKTSPSISATQADSYPPPPSTPSSSNTGLPNSESTTSVQLGMAPPAQPQYPPQPFFGPGLYAAPRYPNQYSIQYRTAYFGETYAIGNPSQVSGPAMVAQDPRSQPGGMFTRNLIGSLSANAFKLNDPDGILGIWFVLQDLSVRSEGSFRLKFSFVNVGTKDHPVQLNTGSAPVLASCYSQAFQVYTAKRFPGVIESTRLSKCFAEQGVKIPIRKDGANARGGGGDDIVD